MASAARATAAHPLGSRVGLGLDRPNAVRARLCTHGCWSAGDALFRAHAAPLQESHEQHTIKQLLRLVQELTAERDEAREKLRAARQASGSETAMQEIESLQKQNVAFAQENANMYTRSPSNHLTTEQNRTENARPKPSTDP